MDLPGACSLAVEFTHRAIVTTYRESKDHRFGPKFEVHLPWLCRELETFRKEHHGFTIA